MIHFWFSTLRGFFLAKWLLYFAVFVWYDMVTVPYPKKHSLKGEPI